MSVQVVANWATSIEMMQALHHGLSRSSCKVWLHWNRHLRILLQLTAKPEGFEQSEETDEVLLREWEDMICSSIQTWERYVGQSVVAMEVEAEGQGEVFSLPHGEELNELLSQTSLSDHHIEDD